MSETVVEFPRERRRHNPVISPREMHAQRECPEPMIWDMCIYLRLFGENSECNECPRAEEDEHHGMVTLGCFVAAHEACRIALAWTKRLEAGS